MASRRRRTKDWLYRAGEKGRNRVTLYARDSGVLFLAWYEACGDRRVVSLGHRDLQRGKAETDARAWSWRPRPEPGQALTLAALFGSRT